MLVNQVFDDSPAEKAGILAGDVVLEVDGKKIRTSSDMVITIGNLFPGTKIQLKISRNGEIKNIPVTLGARDETQIASTVPEEKGSAFKKYGFELAELSATARNKYKIDKNISGVMILRVNPSGISKEAGLQAGDVITKINNKPVKNIEEVEKILKASENQSAYFFIYRDKKEFIVMM
jgi:serine protease Do